MDLITNESTEAFVHASSWPTYDEGKGWINDFGLDMLTGWSKWHIFLTIIVALITYDQGWKFPSYIDSQHYC
jgi:hypothetical protein